MTSFLNLLIPLAVVGGMYWLVARWSRKAVKEKDSYPAARVVNLDEIEKEISD